MEFDLEVKMAVYHHFAASGARPSATQIAGGLDVTVASVREAFGRLRTQRVLVLEADGESGASPSGGVRGWSSEVRLAVPLCGARGTLVGRHRLHLKQDAILPVGRARS